MSPWTITAVPLPSTASHTPALGAGTAVGHCTTLPGGSPSTGGGASGSGDESGVSVSGASGRGRASALPSPPPHAAPRTSRTRSIDDAARERMGATAYHGAPTLLIGKTA